MDNPKGFLTHEEVDQFYELASHAEGIINYAGDVAGELRQSIEDDVDMIFDGFTEGVSNALG